MTDLGSSDGRERTRLVGDVVVTMDDEQRVLRPGAMDVVAGRLAWVGSPADAPAGGPADGVLEVHDVGGLLMPGLVNTHAHTPMTLVRSAGDGMALDQWLRRAVWPREANMDDEDAYWGMMLGAGEMLSCGVTTTCEMYLHGRAVVGAVLDAGLRCTLTPGIFDLPQLGPLGSWEACLDAAGALHAELDGRDDRIEVGLGPHSAYLLPPECLATVGRLAGELGALVHIHLAETEAEGTTINAAHGCSAPRLLARLGLLDNRVLAAHSVWLSDADLDLYSEHDVAVAHCPQSNGKLGSGVARVADMLRRGLRVGIGTDSPASNDNLDLWEEMRLTPLLARAVDADPGAISTRQALVAATRGGAEALGLGTGVLAAGRPADVIRLALADACFAPALDVDELLGHLVWAASSRQVTDVWVAGRHVVRAGRCVSVDMDRATGEVTRRARRLAGLAS